VSSRAHSSPVLNVPNVLHVLHHDRSERSGDSASAIVGSRPPNSLGEPKVSKWEGP
jgi:hypothetical protein